jgi:hypothetical protein
MSTETYSGKREWSPAETEDFYKKLLEQALATIPTTGAAMVLGPMFRIRSPKDNFALFEKAQRSLAAQGIQVFDQLPFVDYNLGENNAPFKYDIKFEVFYKPLIESGKINACYCLPDWEQSEGTKSEIRYCKNAGVPVYDVDRSFLIS